MTFPPLDAAMQTTTLTRRFLQECRPDFVLPDRGLRRTPAPCRGNHRRDFRQASYTPQRASAARR